MASIIGLSLAIVMGKPGTLGRDWTSPVHLGDWTSPVGLAEHCTPLHEPRTPGRALKNTLSENG